MTKSDDIEVTDQDVTDALTLARKHVYRGAEPYAPAVMSFARMLAEHRELVTARLKEPS